MLTLEQATRAPQPVTLAGQSYPVRQLMLSEWAELQAWLKSVCPSPVGVAAKALAELQAQGLTVPTAVQETMFRQAQEESRRWPPKVGTREWLQALDDIEGGRGRFIRAALGPGGTAVDPTEADQIAAAASNAELWDLIRVTIHGEHIAPKAGAGAAQIPAAPPIPTTGNGSMAESSSSIPPGITAPSAVSPSPSYGRSLSSSENRPPRPQ